jgi:hypothetical protein
MSLLGGVDWRFAADQICRTGSGGVFRAIHSQWRFTDKTLTWLIAGWPWPKEQSQEL